MRRCAQGLCALLVAGGALSGCASTPAGIAGHESFVDATAAQILSGPRPAVLAAGCFENTASFLPLSEFSRDPHASTFVYRLRVADQWFEQVVIVADGTGSRAEVRVAGNLDARWHARFERDRARPLATCLGMTGIPLARGAAS